MFVTFHAIIFLTRSSATAERQRVSYARLSRLTPWSCTSLQHRICCTTRLY